MTVKRRRFLLGGLAGLGLPAAAVASAPPAEAVEGLPAIASHFGGVRGTFVLHDVGDDTQLVHGPERADEPLLPASTFKIAHSLIALETGVVADADVVLPWDGQKRWSDEWNRDHDMRSAIAVSAVWFYQELARRIGARRMQEWVDRLGYGNRDISGGIDTFWLSGGLRITARQQVAFLRRLHAEELPCSPRAQRLVKEMLVMERGGAHVLWAKTGLTNAVEPAVAWLVGGVDRGPRAWIFASNIAVVEGTDVALRKTIPLGILDTLGLRE